MTDASSTGSHLSQLADLTARAMMLEPDAIERRRLTNLVVAHAEAFLSAVPSAPAFIPSEHVADALGAYGIPDTPRAPAEVLEVVDRLVERPGAATTSPRYAGYIPSGGVFTAALADFLAAVSNRYSGQAAVSPGAAGLEKVVVRWLADVLGLGGQAGGVLTSGGSIGALASVVVARDSTGILSSSDRAVVYLGDQTHHSIESALRVAGLGGCIVRRVPSDRRHRMDVEALAHVVRNDRQAHLRPFLVVATAGTTNSGSVDPLDRIAHLARREDLWFHVDAAYGGLFALSPLARDVLAGIELADSVVIDPHKTLFLPYGTGAVLVRDQALLETAFSVEADYLAPRPSAEPLSSADLGPELTTHFRALRVWLPLQLAGRAAFEAALTEKIVLARHVHEELTAAAALEVGPAPDLSIVTFRAVGRSEDPDEDTATRELATRLRESGETFLTTTRLDGRLVLRVAIGSFRTHLPDAERIVTAVRSAARASGSATWQRSGRAAKSAGPALRLEFEPGSPDLDTLACEASVLGQRYGNTAEDLQAAYAAYADSTAFLTVRDRARRVIGWARLIMPGRYPLKTLADVAAPPWGADVEAIVNEIGLDLERTWDVTTIGVRRELGASGSVVAAALYHGIIVATRVNGADWILALLDVRVRALLDRVGLVTDTLPLTTARPYFGSPSTVPVVAHMERMVGRQQREHPEAYRHISLGLGLEGIAVPEPEEFLLSRRAEVDLRDSESRTA